MADPPVTPVLRKPPGYRDPNASSRPVPKPTPPDGTFLSARTVARVEIENPNGKLTYYYGGSDVDVTVGKDRETKLGSAFVDGFTQKKKNITSLKIETQVKDRLVDDSTGEKLREAYKNKGLVVNVAVRSKVGLGVEGIKIGFLSVNVLCGDVSLKKLDNVMPKCTINMFKWINIH
ncbi:uncharacterized protein LOC119984580 isoform X2 [Tripterygium wilfordii]|uniref:uncharacterized protein LOC119984580 isoform X2 n=1 Tax=Tripterygium wilfordii TaxID=458696 RepID=UPI0018F7ED3E|nr:uncharacterized protein LOC119984580 isoform X2 [Tripterygium wilfordii]